MPFDGSWRLAVDDLPSLVSGTLHDARSGSQVELVMDSTAEWRPGRLPWLMRSRWERKSGESGAAYRRVMRTT